MSDSPTVLTSQQFARRIAMRHRDNHQVRYAFILGAGASKEAGIRLAAEYVDEWLADLKEQHESDQGGTIDQWASELTLGIPGFSYDRRAAHYFQIYDLRFPDVDDGRVYFERDLKGRQPTAGHRILAQILAGVEPVGPRHNVVLTTNFDHLLELALQSQLQDLPRVYGAPALASMAKLDVDDPVVLKIHNDLWFCPMNRSCEMTMLAEGWHKPLTDLFTTRVPIFIGYNGHDHTLWDFLCMLQPEKVTNGFYWGWFVPEGLEHSPDFALRPEIWELVSRFNGVVFQHQGFESLMVQIADAFGICREVVATPEAARVQPRPTKRLIYPLALLGLGAALATIPGRLPSGAPAAVEPTGPSIYGVVSYMPAFATAPDGSLKDGPRMPAEGVHLVLRDGQFGGSVIDSTDSDNRGYYRLKVPAAIAAGGVDLWIRAEGAYISEPLHVILPKNESSVLAHLSAIRAEGPSDVEPRREE